MGPILTPIGLEGKQRSLRRQIGDDAAGQASEFGRIGGKNTMRMAGCGKDAREPVEACVDCHWYPLDMANRRHAADGKAGPSLDEIGIRPSRPLCQIQGPPQFLSIAAPVARHQRHHGAVAGAKDQGFYDRARLAAERSRRIVRGSGGFGKNPYRTGRSSRLEGLANPAHRGPLEKRCAVHGTWKPLITAGRAEMASYQRLRLG